MMKVIGIGVLMVMGLLAERPNVVLIIADDMAWDDCGPYGHESLPTPNLDRMAQEGMKFEKGFVTISSCSPSRASLLLGQYATTTDADELHWPVPAEKVSFVEKLREAGYWTGAAGKWHLGEAMKERFDEVMEVDTSGFQLPSGEAAKSGKFKETLSGEAQSGCADWLPLLGKREEGKPFFLWLAALDPHRPYHEGIVAEPATEKMVKIPPYHPNTPAVVEDYLLYYDEIIRLDKYVGLVLEGLEKAGVAENTLVLFFSDNGRPFPRDKTTLYDSGMRTPFLVWWPKGVKAGSVCEEVVSTVDIARTCLELAGVTEGLESFKGQSFVPQLKDPKSPGREYAFAEKNWHDYEDHVRAVRGKRFKYIRNYYEDLPQTPSADSARSATYEELKRLRDEGTATEAQLACFVAPRPKEELFDTVADPFELKNLAGERKFEKVLLEMRIALANWEAENGDAPPELRTADEFHRVTGLPTEARVRPRRTKAEMVEMGLSAP
ncbi:MAG: sulfatase [Verrucomicrobiota bacterium]